MSKKGTRALASATLMSLVLTTALSAGPVKAAAGQATRVGEADRYSTAAKVATTNWDKAETVVLVNGEGYADAVSGSALAKKLNAPILLTAGNALTTETKEALTKLGAKNVYVVGGNASVSAALRTELKASYTVTELGGANRYETNAAVAEELVKLGVDPANVMMVGGEGFSDALSVAPVAAAKGQILLLGMNDANYMKPVVDFVKKHNSKVTVVGTKGVISEAIYNAIGATSRVDGGADRWDTNQKVLAAFKDTVKFEKLYVASASYNAKDNGFADALVASALAGKYAAPLVLVDKDGAAGTNNALAYIKTNATKKTDLNVVGGTGVVSDTVLNAITKAVNPDVPGQNGDNTVAEINPINLNQFDIVFNTNVDEDTAELASNYKVAGEQLVDAVYEDGVLKTGGNAHVELINDNTVRVTLVREANVFKNISQGNEKTVSVKKGILTADKTQTIETFDKKIEFKDITAPTLKNVSIRGNNKLVIEFTEAVNMNNLTTLKSLIQIDGKNLSNVTLTPKEEATDKTNRWASKVEIYSNTGFGSGEKTVKVKDGKSADNVLVDAAGFVFKEETQTITIDKVTTEPVIKDVTCTDDGELRITFDRAMDSKIEEKDISDYFEINDKPIDGAKIELKDDDTVMKITNIPDGVLKDNTNVLSIVDGADVKDAYGNKMDDEIRKSFDKEKDETKPTVLSATIIDSKTIRVQFSEDVKVTYATNEDNYELKDSDGIDLMDKSGVSVKAADGSKDNTDTYDIVTDGTKVKFDSSKYTLTVKNIVDTATEPNKMDDYTTTIDGDDDEAPSVGDITAYVKAADEGEKPTEVAIYFGEEMDSSSISDKSNYYYINGEGESKDLPEDADITVSADNESVVIDFDDANKTIDPEVKASDEDAEDIVKQIGIKAVKDASGNEVYPGAIVIKAGTVYGPTLEDNTFKLYKDGDDIKAEFKLDTALDSIEADDFSVAGQVADDADFDGKTVTLTFDEDTLTDDDKDGDTTKVQVIERTGVKAALTIKDKAESEDLAGRKVSKVDAEQVYYYAIAPETDRDSYKATLTLEDDKTKDAKISIVFKAPIDDSMLGSYKNDFIFTNATRGVNLDVAGAPTLSEDGRTLTFTIAKEDITNMESGDDIHITAASDVDDIDIRTPEDLDGNNVEFVPSDDDKKIKKVDVELVDKTALADAIVAANAAMEGVVISADGTDVVPASKWVTQAVSDELADAITEATEAKKDATTTKQAEDAAKVLDTAVVKYNAAKADGTKA